MARDCGGGSRRAALGRPGESCAGGRSKLVRRCGAVDVEWAGAGRRACFSSRGLELLQAARWQIRSGDGAVRTCMASNWIGSASRVRAERSTAATAGAQWRGRWRSGSGFTCTRGVQGAGDDSGLRLGRLRRGLDLSCRRAAQPAYLTVAANKRWQRTCG
jgi:hypothetical protein